MIKSIKSIIVVLFVLLLLSVQGCKKEEVQENIDAPISHEVISLYENYPYIVKLSYDDLNMDGLKTANDKSLSFSKGSITFAEYDNGDIGSIRNMDMQYSDYCGFEFSVAPGVNSKYSFWGLSYDAFGEQSYYDILENGISDEYYNSIPFTACDTMSFGYTDDGVRFSLYTSLTPRYECINDDGKYEYECTGTYPNATFKCNSQSVATLIAANCISINQALAFVGAVDEDYNRIYSSTDPSLSVSTSKVIFNDKEYMRFDACALEDSSGRYGVLEFVDNKAIWHEGCNYSFNYFIQDEYLLNEDDTYKQKNGTGFGRYDACVPYIDSVLSTEDHLRLMNGINYSYLTYYNEKSNHVGFDFVGKPLNWKSEFCGYDVFETYDRFLKLGLDLSKADELYPLFAYYYDNELENNVLIDSYETWLTKKDNLKCIYDANYCTDERNNEELLNLIRWNGALYNSLSDEDVIKTNSGFVTFIKVIADPMNYRVTRWFGEEVTTSNTIVFDEIYKENKIVE